MAAEGRILQNSLLISLLAEYLTPKEVDRLQDAARKHSRYGHRDATATAAPAGKRSAPSSQCPTRRGRWIEPETHQLLSREPALRSGPRGPSTMRNWDPMSPDKPWVCTH